MTDATDKNGDAKKLPDRRDTLKITAAAGLSALFAPIVKLASPLAGASLSAVNARKLRTTYLLLQTGHAIKPSEKTEVYPAGVEAIKTFAKEIMRDDGSSPAVKKIMQRIIDLPNNPKIFHIKSGALGNQLRKVVPGLHELVVQEHEENMRWIDEEVARHNDSQVQPDSSKGQRDAKLPLSRDSDTGAVTTQSSHEPLLSTDSENVYRRIRNVTTEGKTGEEPFAERLLQDKQSILPKR